MIYSDDYWNDIKQVCEHIPNLKKLNNKRILITGASGMVCSSIVDILVYLKKRQNMQITIMLAGRNESKIKLRYSNLFEYTYIQFDATNTTKIDLDVDYIIHGASNANPAVYTKEPVETLIGNIIGTNALLELAKKKKARFIYISSSEVYGKKNNEQSYAENDYGVVDNLNPRACYPNGKRAAETLCVCYEKEYKVDIVIVRPGHVYGPTITESDTRASAQFTRNILNGENIIMKSPGAQLRSYCYTLDCAAAILTVLLNGKTGEAYNISNSNSIVTIREFAEALAAYAKTEIIFENPSDIEKKGFNMMSNSSLDSKKIEALGWKAIFDLRKGIRRTMEILGNE